jgi:hypothetical protein
MHLPKPFFQLPRRFDVERLQAEVASLPSSAWAPHPNRIPGNSSVRLISSEGGENDHVDGDMRPTLHLQHTPYIRQILASFGVPWSRSRLLRLAPGASVPPHADINYHWFNRVRVHIPVLTWPEVRFHCDGASIHMGAGEAWVFDNWRLHHVVNPTPHERIHLVADTAGNAAFWELVGSAPSSLVVSLPYRPGSEPPLLTERSVLRPVMGPAEVELLVGNLRGELITQSETAASSLQLARYHGLLDAFVRDWRHFYTQHGEDPTGRGHFERLRESVRAQSRSLSQGIVMRTNRVAAHQVLEGRVLRVVLGIEHDAEARSRASGEARIEAPGNELDGEVAPDRARELARPKAKLALERPIFIVAAPRSGSTLLFETLAASRNLHTLGGEAHWLVESVVSLRPGSPGVDSNRLTAEHATPEHAEHIRSAIVMALHDADNTVVPFRPGIRLLEKTPKNALRIPFFERLFPDALFVFLWRDARENISSIMEAWKAGKWKTYNALPGFDGPWSLLLPPGWTRLRGQPLEEIAAYQWDCTNRIVLEDLAALPKDRWVSLSYADLIRDPRRQMGRICERIGIEVDPALAERLKPPLPHSQYTLTPPRPDKWRSNEAAIQRVLPQVEATQRRLEALP